MSVAQLSQLLQADVDVRVGNNGTDAGSGLPLLQSSRMFYPLAEICGIRTLFAGFNRRSGIFPAKVATWNAEAV